MSTTVHVVPIDETVDEHTLTPQGALVGVERLGFGDGPIHHHRHIYRYYAANPSGWYWGHRARWIARYDDAGRHEMYHPYILHFEDGTSGICQVRQFNDALAEIGYRVDLEPPI